MLTPFECEPVVPPAALKGLGINLASCGREKTRHGEFNFDWKAVIGDCHDDDAEEWDRITALEGPVPNHVMLIICVSGRASCATIACLMN